MSDLRLGFLTVNWAKREVQMTGLGWAGNTLPPSDVLHRFAQAAKRHDTEAYAVMLWPGEEQVELYDEPAFHDHIEKEKDISK